MISYFTPFVTYFGVCSFGSYSGPSLFVLSFPPLLGALLNGVCQSFNIFFPNKKNHTEDTSMVVKTTFISQPVISLPLVFCLTFGFFSGPPTNPNVRLYWCLTHQTSASVNCFPIHTHKREKLESEIR